MSKKVKDQDTRDVLGTFKELKGQQKVQYFVDYLLKWVLLGVFIVIAIIWLINRIVNFKLSVCDVIFVNTDTQVDKPIEEGFFDAYMVDRGFEPKKYEIDYSVSADLEKTQEKVLDNNRSSQAMQAIEMQLYGNLVDVLFADENVYEMASQEGFLQDVRTYLPEELIKEYEDQFYWIDFKEDGQKHAVGIILDQNNPFMKNSGLYKDKAVAGVVVGCPQDANAKDFLIGILEGDLYK